MAVRGGPRDPGAGRKKGTPNRATVEKATLALAELKALERTREVEKPVRVAPAEAGAGWLKEERRRLKEERKRRKAVARAVPALVAEALGSEAGRVSALM
jgi:hypothetical protein